MTFVPKAWEDEPYPYEVFSGKRAPTSKTPLDAANLIDQESRLSAYADSIGRGSVVNVRAHGAKGDGTTDDTAAFVSAIAAAPAGGVLALDPGADYSIDCSSPLAVAAGLHVAGEGATMRYRGTAPTTAVSMFAPGNGASLYLEGLTIEGPESIGAGGRFDAVIEGAANASGAVRAVDCDFVRFTSALRVSSSVNWLGTIEAEGCTFTGYGAGGSSMPVLLNKHEPGARGRLLRLRGCDFSAFGEQLSTLVHAVYVSSDWDIEIVGNRFLTSVGSGYGVQIFDEEVSVANGSPHQIIAANQFGVGLTCSGIVCAGVSRPLIEANTFELEHLAVRLNGGAPTIRGNTFPATNADGAHIQTIAAPRITAPVTIDSNELTGRSTKLIVIAHNGDYAVTNNRLDPATNPSYLISVEGGTPSVVVKGNDFEGAANSAIMRINVAGKLHVVGNTVRTGGGAVVEYANAGAGLIIDGNDLSQTAGTSVVVETAPSSSSNIVAAGNVGTAVGVASVASAATVTLPVVGEVFKLTGVAEVKSITASWPGRRVVLVITETAKLLDGEDLKLSAAGPVTADDTISLVCDGTNWYETGRSVN